MNCVFCNIPAESYLSENSSFYAIKDKFPVTKGHTLIVSKRHFATIFDIHEEEMADLRKMILAVKEILDERFSPNAYNIGVNCGKQAGQSVFHFHMHVIPRYASDRSGNVRRKMQGLREYISELL